MNKELIDSAWRCLPREFKEEVKKEWRTANNEGTRLFDTILKDGFHNHNRLHIAAMAMQGLLSNQKWMKNKWECAKDAVGEDDDYDYDEAMTELVRYIATEALEYADALMKAAGKGGGE